MSRTAILQRPSGEEAERSRELPALAITQNHCDDIVKEVSHGLTAWLLDSEP